MDCKQLKFNILYRYSHLHFLLHFMVYCQALIFILYSIPTLHLYLIHLTQSFLVKQLNISTYMLVHLPFKLFSCLLFAMIHTSSNLYFFSLQTPIHLHSTSLTLFQTLPSMQLTSFSCSFDFIIPPYILQVLFPYLQ